MTKQKKLKYDLSQRGGHSLKLRLSLLAGVAMILSACGNGADKSKAADPVLVEIKRAQSVNAQTEIVATGSFRREKEIDLSFRIGGVLREVNYR